ncbi:MAG: peptidoglycan DD-metalloendopeptidase family protein [Gammaproteobacteria bacterium]|nr:peptidoglycan DD-metalloendopeptidase family protein [Gammaproteobacteria bacterium]
MIKTLIALFFILTMPAAMAGSLPSESLVPGGIALIKLGHKDNATPRVHYGSRKVLTLKQGSEWFALLGIPLSTKPGEHSISTRWPSRHALDSKALGSNALSKHFINVKHKKYLTQRITIKNKRMVNPTAEDLERIASERARKRRAKATWSTQAASLDFIQPVQGIMTGSYGKRRVFNGQRRNPHSGMDIAADKGTDVLAAADGRIVETGNFYFSGNVIYIDHGQGLISLYAHLDQTQVKIGDQIKQGQVIGQVGSTGRVTGPHLHWSVALNNTWINPALFLQPIEKKQVE